jgi:hypothetical protein
MEMTLIIPGAGESLLILAVVTFLVTVTVMISRSRKPDPKMQLLVALMKKLPPDKNGPDPSGESGNDEDPREEQGPLGPSGFSHIASGNSNLETSERLPVAAGWRLPESETSTLRAPLARMIPPGALPAAGERARSQMR